MTETRVFHAGERAVQARAGVDATDLGEAMIQTLINADFAAFLASQPWVILACSAPDGRVWCSLLAGPPGFARASAANEVRIAAAPPADDPLALALDAGPVAVGMLVIEPARRLRIRLNGQARRTPEGIAVTLAEVFGNCPKYIGRRTPVALVPAAGPGEPALAGTQLSEGQIALVETADTFFIASAHESRGADASHRGGRPGFVQVRDGGRALTFPDYAGNNMFQTLGNLTLDPRAGLLVLDWETGRTLQISGRAQIVWDEERLAAWPRARRLVDLEIEAVRDRAAGSPLRWRFLEASRLNPPVGPEPVGSDAQTAVTE